MDIAHGLERVLELSDTLPIAAANLSLGSGFFFDPCDFENPMVTAAIVNLRAAGVATIASSGNDGSLFSMNFPACISTAISVGATSDGSGGLSADLVMAFSNSAYFLSLLAPGFLDQLVRPGGGFVSGAGTSLAAAHVAGAWAIAKQANPGASVDDVLFALRNTGKAHRGSRERPHVLPRITATLLQFSADNVQRDGDAGTATITVTRSGAMFGLTSRRSPSTTRRAPARRYPSEDYTETFGTLFFNTGETSKTFTVQIAPRLQGRWHYGRST